MKKLLFFVLLGLLIASKAKTQGVGIGTSTPQASAMLDITSTSKGILIPRMSSPQRIAIASPVNGLMVYDTDTNSFWYYNGTSWSNLSAQAAAVGGWGLSGNIGTTPENNFIGTTDNQSLQIKINNQGYGLLNKNGSLFLGFNAGPTTPGYNNIGIGSGALRNSNNHSNLIAIGDSALFNNVPGGPQSGLYNTAIGSKALFANLTGTQNTAVGYNSSMNVKGSFNTSLGYNALKNTQYANVNTAIGARALQENVQGYANTAVGSNTMYNNLDGNYNVGLGTDALQANTSGSDNVALGQSSLYSNLTGNGNVAVGVKTLFYYKGSYCIGIGDSALHTNGLTAQFPGEAERNVAIGAKAMWANFTGYDNTAIGFHAMKKNKSGDNNVALGREAMLSNMTGYFNTSIGSGSMRANEEGFSNTAVGYGSLFNNFDGDQNIGVGASSLLSNTSGSNNIGIGILALRSNQNGNSNIAIGTRALNSSVSKYNNLAIGDSAMMNTGAGASAATEAIFNVAVGAKTLFQNTTGFRNTAIGLHTLYNNTTGSHNTAVGLNAAGNLTTGTNNTAIGNKAMESNITGGGNTIIGSLANTGGNNLSNATAIGYDAIVSASNKVRIGNTNVTVIEGQVPFSSPSDGRFKTNVSEEVKGVAFIMKLRPVVYNFKSSQYEAFLNNGVIKAGNEHESIEKIRQSGFIAQEVEAAAKASNYDFNGVKVPSGSKDTYSVSYSQFVVPLVKAVQEQQQQIEDLQKQINELKKLITTSK